MKKESNISFLVTNISNRNVTLTDLAVTIPAFRTVNLMDTKHYKYTIEQLQKSKESGSLFLKRNKVSVRNDNLKLENSKYIDIIIASTKKDINLEGSMPSREKSTLVIREEKYEELNISDEEFASENADIVEMDSKPMMVNKG